MQKDIYLAICSWSILLNDWYYVKTGDMLIIEKISDQFVKVIFNENIIYNCNIGWLNAALITGKLIKI